MLWEACRYNQKPIVQVLLKHGVDVDAMASSIHPFSGALYRAASVGHTSMVRYLLSHGADVNLPGLKGFGNLPIDVAAFNGQDEVVALLIANGANPAKALCRADEGGQTHLMRLLITRFPNILQESIEVRSDAFFKAFAAGNLTGMTILVEAGVPINHGLEYESGGCLWDLPINMAKECGLKWVVEHLICLGAEDTDTELGAREHEVAMRGIRVSKRTWEWVGRY